MPQLTLVGHKYLGPGNPLNNGKPVNSADKIAQIHDTEYSQAKTQEDILISDKLAIQDFKDDFVKQPSIGSFLGYSGLSIKHAIESGIGKVIYPPNLSGKYVEEKSKLGLYYKCC